MGPILFTLYTNPLACILESASNGDENSGFHLYADDTQDYLAFQMSSLTIALDSVSKCVSDVSTWLAKNGLSCNNDKTEFMLIRSMYMRSIPDIPALKVVDCVVNPSDSARNLGVIFDKLFTFKQHVSSVVRSGNLGIRNISQIRKYLTTDTAKVYTQMLITSRLDFCNSLLYDLPSATVSPLQRVQNTAARLVTRSRKSVHITPILSDLHWLPVAQRIKFKILVFTYKAIHDLAPGYICELISARRHSRVLRSTNDVKLHQPVTAVPSYGDRAFSVAAPLLWNELATSLTSCTDIESFKALLKTHLFREAFKALL